MSKSILSYVTLILLPLLIYFPILRHDFTYFDDQQLIIDQHTYLTDPTNLLTAFLEPLFAHTYHQATLYRPLLNITLILNTLLLGTSAPTYLLINILLHCTTTLLLYHMLKTLSPPISRYHQLSLLLLTLLFSLHPLHISTIALIPNRADLLLGLFSLLTIYCLHRHLTNNLPALPPSANPYLLLSLGSYLLALLSKETALFLLPALLTYPILFKRQKKSSTSLSSLYKTTFPYLLYLIPILIMLTLRHIAFTDLPSYTLQFHISGLITNAPGLLLSIGKTLIPVQLSPTPNLIDHHIWYGIITVLIYLTIYLKLPKGSRPLYLWSFIGVIILLIPTLLNIDPGEQTLLHYPHRLYLPLIILTIGLYQAAQSIPKKYITLLYLPIPLYLTIIHLQLPNYQNDLTFWQHATQTAPSSATAHTNLASAHLRHQDLHAAQTHYLQATQLHPQSMVAYAGLAHIAYRRQDYPQAITYLNHQHQYRTSADTLHLLALAYYHSDQTDQSLTTLIQAHTANPHHLDTLIMLTQIYYNAGQLDQALPHYLQATQQGHQFTPDIIQALEAYKQILPLLNPNLE